jgi:hypothetical protein
MKYKNKTILYQLSISIYSKLKTQFQIIIKLSISLKEIKKFRDGVNNSVPSIFFLRDCKKNWTLEKKNWFRDRVNNSGPSIPLKKNIIMLVSTKKLNIF